MQGLAAVKQQRGVRQNRKALYGDYRKPNGNTSDLQKWQKPDNRDGRTKNLCSSVGAHQSKSGQGRQLIGCCKSKARFLGSCSLPGTGWATCFPSAEVNQISKRTTSGTLCVRQKPFGLAPEAWTGKAAYQIYLLAALSIYWWDHGLWETSETGREYLNDERPQLSLCLHWQNITQHHQAETTFLHMDIPPSWRGEHRGEAMLDLSRTWFKTHRRAQILSSLMK